MNTLIEIGSRVAKISKKVTSLETVSNSFDKEKLLLRLLIFLFPWVLFAQVTRHEFVHAPLKLEIPNVRGSGPLVVNSSRGTLYFYPKEGEGKKLRNLLSMWRASDKIEGWSVPMADPKLLAIENQTRGSVVFAYLTARPPESLGGEKRDIQLIGERCSGTNFLQVLVSKHLPVKFVGPYGSKHFPTWFNLTHQWKRDSNIIFLVIFRNPYDWLRSFYKTPHHTAPHLDSTKGATFSDFVHGEWMSLWGDGKPVVEDLNPVGNTPFENVLKMRSAKVDSFLALKEAPNHFMVRYEDLHKAPFLYILKLAETFDLWVNSIFTPIEIHAYTKQPMPKMQKYPPIPKSVKAFVDEQLDWDLEQEVGYTTEDYS